MPILVQKFGGSSVSDADKISAVAERVVAARQQGYDMVVVVSAMGETTDELIELAHRVHPEPPRRELDMLLSVGERISMALLSMAIQQRGFDAISFTGSQSGIITNDRHSDARIIEVRPFRIQDELCRGRIVIVAGYQGMSYKREITTLGRGGSDTTAVALAAALNAESCEIYGDVDGVYTADPRAVPEAQRIDSLDYPEMQELAESGARVLNATAVEFAKERGIGLFVRRADGHGGQTLVRQHPPLGPGRVVGIAHEASVHLITAASPEARFGLLALLDEQAIPGKQLSLHRFGASYGTAVVVSREHLPSAEPCRQRLAARFGEAVRLDDELGAVSLIGAGINQSFANIRRALQVLDEQRIRVEALHTSSFRITALLPAEQLEDALRALHRVFIEEPEPGETC
ncbi:MAG: aspartate kinase [Deltaproteobacteria bacterium]|nr:aspartate kinase [Deltaproteobacteria bacterium]